MHNANDVKVAKRVTTLYMKSKYVLSKFDVKPKEDAPTNLNNRLLLKDGKWVQCQKESGGTEKEFLCWSRCTFLGFGRRQQIRMEVVQT